MTAKTAAAAIAEDESKRVEHAMELLEQAKRKARQQKEEYGAYLQWKVGMQRKERRQREKEEAAHQEEMQQHLRQVLREHREQRRQEQRRYYATPAAPGNGASPGAGASGGLTHNPALSPAAKRAAHREWGSTGDGDTADDEQELLQQQTRAGQQNPFDKLRDRITFEDVLRLPSVTQQQQPAYQQLVVPGAAQAPARGLHLRRPPPPPPLGCIGAQPVPRGPRRVFRLPVEAKPFAITTQKRLRKVGGMLDKARRRRAHATDLMHADPPADYDFHADGSLGLLRYIPADFLGANPGPSGTQQAKSNGKDFFLTAVQDPQEGPLVHKARPPPVSELRGRDRRIGRHYHHFNTRLEAPPLVLGAMQIQKNPSRQGRTAPAALGGSKLRNVRGKPKYSVGGPALDLEGDTRENTFDPSQQRQGRGNTEANDDDDDDFNNGTVLYAPSGANNYEDANSHAAAEAEGRRLQQARVEEYATLHHYLDHVERFTRLPRQVQAFSTSNPTPRDRKSVV